MSNTLKFKEEAIQKAKDEYKQIKLEPLQKELIQQTAGLLKQYVPIPLMAVKGSMWHTIRRYQTENKMTLAELAELPPREKFSEYMKLIDIGKEQIQKMLINSDEQTKLLDEAFVEVKKIATQVFEERLQEKGL